MLLRCYHTEWNRDVDLDTVLLLSKVDLSKPVLGIVRRGFDGANGRIVVVEALS